MKTLLIFGLVMMFSLVNAQTISFNGCHYLFDNQNYTFNLTGADVTGRNGFETTPSNGDQPCGGIGTCEFKIIWNIASSRWEFLADGGNGGFSESLLMYYNTANSTPNPPSLSLGAWIENTPVTQSLCGGNLGTGNATLSGSVQNTVLGVDTFSENTKVTLYPNPAKTELTILTSETINHIAVWNLQGQEIYSFENLNNKVDVSIFKTGLYFIKLQTNNGLRVATFIKE